MSQGQAADYYNGQYQAPQGPPPSQNNYGQPQPVPQNYYGQPASQQSQSQGYGAPQQQMQYEEPKQGGYPQNPPMYGNDYAPPQQGKETFDQTFKINKPKFNDVWAGILFILVFLGFTAVSGLTLYRYSKYHTFNGGGIYNAQNDFSLNTNTLVLFAFIIVVSFVLSWAYFLAARAFTKQFVWLTGILNCVLAVGTAVYYWYRHYWSAAIIFTIFAVFAIFCFISWIPRIPFAVVMLQQAQDVARMKRAHVFILSFVGGVAALAFSAWFSATLVAIYTAYEPSNANANANPACAAGGCSSAKVIGLIVFVTFAGYWISEWIKNTLHCATAGVYGAWYFSAGGEIPRGATMGALRRATTYSFGSVSFGSLVVAIINMIRQACSIAQADAQQDGNIIACVFFCILQCIIGFIDWAVQFINRYAFSTIALYGKAYIPAAKDTWALMKDRGIDALINDCLTGPVLTMGSTFVAYCTALLAYLYLEFTNPAYNQGRTFTPVIMAFAFLIGLQVCQIFMTPVGSGIDTIFVAMGFDPAVAAREHPQFWNRLIQVYPRVQEVIHV